MWLRKTQSELDRERRLRRKTLGRYRFVLIMISVASVSLFVYMTMADGASGMPDEAENILPMLMAVPLLLYFGYRNYVIHGRVFNSWSGKVCLSCGIGLGIADEAWGYKAYGKHRKRWYQVRACATPERCDIAYQYELRWAEDNEQANGSDGK